MEKRMNKRDEGIKNKINYDIGKKYNYMNEIIQYIGLREKGDRVHSEIGDFLTDKPVLLFKWLTENHLISSRGIKGHIIALGKKKAFREIIKKHYYIIL
jgi:hypothetical protein